MRYVGLQSQVYTWQKPKEGAFGEKKNVQLRTPTAVAAIRGTKYRAKAGENESEVLVYEGKVDVNAAKNVMARLSIVRSRVNPQIIPYCDQSGINIIGIELLA